ncbi:MAG: SWIM zinc finger family protein [Ilumatobacteraceae bacterium]
MSRPRKPFGVNHPGRLPATMMKVLAAEMSDPQRLRRGKQYAQDGSVLDIVIEPGIVTCEVQGSRSTPYVVTIQVTAGDGMPMRRDIETTCSCPDADNWDDHACKHAVAAMFTLSDEFLMEPELLDVWRNRQPNSDGDDDGPHDDRDEPDDEQDRRDHSGGIRRRHLRLVDPDERPHSEPERVTPPEDRLDGLLTIPAGAHLPEVPDLERIEPDLPRPPQLAAILRDALANLRIEWD